jgi:hypothetical protein
MMLEPSLNAPIALHWKSGNVCASNLDPASASARGFSPHSSHKEGELFLIGNERISKRGEWNAHKSGTQYPALHPVNRQAGNDCPGGVVHKRTTLTSNMRETLFKNRLPCRGLNEAA